MSAVLRQWCGKCQAATVTWLCIYGDSHCAGHEPRPADAACPDDAAWGDDE